MKNPDNGKADTLKIDTLKIDKRSFCLGAASLVMAAGSAAAQTKAPAADALPSVSPQYIVTYFEVAPASAAGAARLSRSYRAATAKETGRAPFELFQGAYLPYHFATIGRWQDTNAFVAHSEGTAMKTFRAALAPHLISPYDERRHHALEVGQSSGKSSLVTITHVDIIPTYREPGIESVKKIASQSRTQAGCTRFDALTQSARPNHMTVVQAWRDDASYRRYIVSMLSKAFRDSLLVRSGSLYDERYYRPLA
jgi:quinol monooxygenase YgiN